MAKYISIGKQFAEFDRPTCPRVMAVLDPVRVVITNLSSSDCVELEVPNIPQLPDKGTHKVTFDPCELYIERSDLREVRMCDSVVWLGPAPWTALLHVVKG